MPQIITRSMSWSLSTCILCAGVQAAPGTLSNTPLSITAFAEPNIMLLLDNSASMSTEGEYMSTGLDSAKAAAIEFLADLDQVNIGLTRFNLAGGGTLLRGIRPLASADYRTQLIDALADISPVSDTAMAETLAQIGRYFIEGKETQLLTQHPHALVPTRARGDQIFNRELTYASGVNKPTGLPLRSGLAETPIQHHCQKNFIVSLTDGLDLAEDEWNAASVGELALDLYEMDLRPDLNDFDGQPVRNHIVTFILGVSADASSKARLTTVSNKGGGHTYQADQVPLLVSELNALSAHVATTKSSVAGVALNANTLREGTALFQTQFDSANWSGDVVALPLAANGSLPADDDHDGNPDPAWGAAERLDALTTAELSRRVILTHDGADGVALTYVDARHTPSSTHAEDLRTDTAEPLSVSELQARLAYLRGDRSNEGSAGKGLRQRHSILGDIVNSSPVYVSAPTTLWPDSFGTEGNRHGANFVQAALTDAEDGSQGRIPMLYVGANDGLLHGFNATLGEPESGKELLAYLPSQILSTAHRAGLHYYLDRSYQHQFFVDLTPTVADVYLKNNAHGERDWRTVLIGGLGAGGKGYFALDVTNPAQFSNSLAAAQDTVLWEFTETNIDVGDSTNGRDLGYSFSQPVIANMNNGQWAAIFGNGYHSANGVAKLFIVYLEQGLDGWTLADYRVISTGSGTSNDKNGLSSPAVIDTNHDGLADRIYAGDLLGQLWVFDVSASNDQLWQVAHAGRSATGAGQPLLVAQNDSGQVQPITAAPLITKLELPTETGTRSEIMVLFGTGQYLAHADLAELSQQTFYAVLDSDHTDAMTRANLQARTLTEVTHLGQTLRTVSGEPVDWARQQGWYLDLAEGVLAGEAGERVVTAPQLVQQSLFFNTLIPNAQPCATGGSGWLLNVDYATGLSLADQQGDPLASFDVNHDKLINATDLTDLGVAYVGVKQLGGLPAQSTIIENLQITPISDGSLAMREIALAAQPSEGRLGWQEVSPQ